MSGLIGGAYGNTGIGLWSVNGAFSVQFRPPGRGAVADARHQGQSLSHHLRTQSFHREFVEKKIERWRLTASIATMYLYQTAS